MPLLPPPLVLPFESPCCPPEISQGASNWSLASLDVVATLKQSIKGGGGATLRRCKVLPTVMGKRGGGRGGEEGGATAVVVVKSLSLSPTATTISDHAAVAALSEASAHAAAFSLAPDAVLPLYAAFVEEAAATTNGSEGGTSPPGSASSSSQALHLVLAAAAGTARDAAAGSGGFLLEEHAAVAALSALRGCAALHSMGLVHGDVKPENLLVLPRLKAALRERGGEEEEGEEEDSACSSSAPPSSSFAASPPPFSFALSDFGSACPIGGPLPLGTLDFLPPEAAAAAAAAAAAKTVAALGSKSSLASGGGDDGFSRLSSSSSSPPPPPTPAASPAADVWAIGAATVDLLTGGPPFAARAGAGAGAGAGGATAATAATLAAAATEPLRLPRHLSAEAKSFCELCLRKGARERPSCLELCSHEWFK